LRLRLVQPNLLRRRRSSLNSSVRRTLLFPIYVIRLMTLIVKSPSGPRNWVTVLKIMMRSLRSATGFFVASKRLKGKLALDKVRRTRRRERALEKLTRSVESIPKRDELEITAGVEDPSGDNDLASDGWETVSGSDGSSESVLPTSIKGTAWEHYLRERSAPLAKPVEPGRFSSFTRIPLEPKSSPEPVSHIPLLKRDHQRWLGLAKDQAHMWIPISLSFKLKEDEKRKVVSLKRFSYRAKQVLPFGDSLVYPNRFSLEAHNARVDLYRQLNRLAFDVACFRCSPEVLRSAIGMAKELQALCHQVVGGLEVSSLLKRLGFLLRHSGGHSRADHPMSSPY